ncbi:hypothetical protein [Synechococcus sp. A15-24]|uniref:hypothetical protein n=1 Tax=Synechococcus sp. A15-24 TaxID=1050635 RepID=UPI0016450DFA|nr:hypothetical protein [Synechococcus sp. A15-24]
MSAPPDPTDRRRLHPLPRGLVELYGLIAVLMVLIPEWLADGTINIGQAGGPNTLPMRARAWRTLPELRLAAMNLKEMRQMASEMRLLQYGNQSRDQLTTRMLKRLRRRNAL